MDAVANVLSGLVSGLASWLTYRGIYRLWRGKRLRTLPLWEPRPQADFIRTQVSLFVFWSGLGAYQLALGQVWTGVGSLVIGLENLLYNLHQQKSQRENFTVYEKVIRYWKGDLRLDKITEMVELDDRVELSWKKHRLVLSKPNFQLLRPAILKHAYIRDVEVVKVD